MIATEFISQYSLASFVCNLFRSFFDIRTSLVLSFLLLNSHFPCISRMQRINLTNKVSLELRWIRTFFIIKDLNFNLTSILRNLLVEISKPKNSTNLMRNKSYILSLIIWSCNTISTLVKCTKHWRIQLFFTNFWPLNLLSSIFVVTNRIRSL